MSNNSSISSTPVATNGPKLVYSRDSNQPVHFTPRAAHKLLLKGELPPNSVIDGGLTFNPGSQPVFPEGVHIMGSLSVAWCGDGLQLGAGMVVDGMADFSMTSLATIPPRLHVKMALDVSHTFISNFPQDMRVDWKIVVGGNVTKAMRDRVAALDRQNAKHQQLRRSTDPK